MRFALDSFSPRELTALIKAAVQQKSRIAKRRPLALVRAELTALAAELGYSINELFEQAPDGAPQPARSRPKRAKSKVAVKYRDPDNRRNTWTGRGSQPRWLREKVSRGLSPADFLTGGLGRPTANTKSIGKRTVFKQA